MKMNQINDTLFDRLSHEVFFKAVNVQHGRKFHGFGYVVSSYQKSNGGYLNSGARPLKYYEVIKVWIPDSKSFDNYNEWKDEEEINLISTEKYRNDLLEYVSGVIEASKKRCGNDDNWRANYLRKVLGIRMETANLLLKI